MTLGALAALALAATAEPCRTVHGRMELWNGAPSVRIWVVGTKRVLGVAQQEASFKDLPLAVRQIWTGADADKDWATAIYGDFQVCPLAAERAGHMQAVRLIDATPSVLAPAPPSLCPPGPAA